MLDGVFVVVLVAGDEVNPIARYERVKNLYEVLYHPEFINTVKDQVLASFLSSENFHGCGHKPVDLVLEVLDIVAEVGRESLQELIEDHFRSVSLLNVYMDHTTARDGSGGQVSSVVCLHYDTHAV